MEMLTRCSRQGGWVLLQNIHLTPQWTAGPLTSFVMRLGQAGVHEEFRRVGEKGGEGRRCISTGPARPLTAQKACLGDF